jgi:hypothetical protein
MSWLTLSGMGQTTSGTSRADAEAMNAPSADLPRLCRAGNALACKLADMPTDTPESAAARRSERDRQAQAERENLARKARAAGLTPKLTAAIREGRDVIYMPAASRVTLPVVLGIATLAAGLIYLASRSGR